MADKHIPVKIYNGIRGDSFKNLLTTILKRGKLSDNVIEKLLDEESMKLYDIAFTHPSVDNEFNYEYLEFLGDGVINTAIVWYLSKRFSNLKGSKGVKVLARLKINLVSKKSFAKFASDLNLWDYISCSENIRATSKKKVLEDVFEALFGAITYLMDYKIFTASGYAVVYAIVSNLFDEMDISLKYESLFDARTRIKELFDHYKDIGELQYQTVKDNNNIFNTQVFLVKPDGNKIYLGSGHAPTKNDSIHNSSQQAINMLKTMGYSKQINPDEYFE
jgi:dsRNA-specific ribonuclease